MLRVVVLGAAAGGGVPQWNCGCPVCRKARTDHPELRSTQASIAISADGERGLRALKFRIFGSRGLTNRTAAIPLRNATTCRGAQDDDAQHDPSPGISESGILGRFKFWRKVLENLTFQKLQRWTRV